MAMARITNALVRAAASAGIALMVMLGTSGGAWAAPAPGSTGNNTSPDQYEPTPKQDWSDPHADQQHPTAGAATEEDQEGPQHNEVHEQAPSPDGEVEPESAPRTPPPDDPPPAADDSPSQTRGPADRDRDPIEESVGSDPSDLGLEDPCLGLDDPSFTAGGAGRLADELCANRDGGGDGGGGARPGTVGPDRDPTDGLGNPDPLDTLCAGVPDGPSGYGRGLGSVSDHPYPWTEAVGRGISDWISDGVDGEEDGKGEQIARAIVSPPIWFVGIIGTFWAETLVNTVTNPLGAAPPLPRPDPPGAGAAAEAPGRPEDDESDDESDDDSAGSGESNGSASDSAGSGSEGGGPDGAVEPVPGQEGEGGIEELCRELRERRRQDPHGRDRDTYAGTDCDDPTTNPAREDETSLDADEPEVEISCNGDDELSAQGSDGDCGTTARPAAGETGCGGGRHTGSISARPGELAEPPVGLSSCNPVLCQPSGGWQRAAR
jgi:hypothetical protein